jgi:hypothetical protein
VDRWPDDAMPASASLAAVRAYAAASVTAECVRLEIDDIGAVDAFVARAVPGAAELLFAGPAPAPARVLHRRSARLTPLPPAGTAELRVTLRALPDAHGAIRADAIVALWAVAAAEPAVTPPPRSPLAAPAPAPAAPAPAASERRGAVRVALRRPVNIHRPGVITDITAQTEDVSETGVSLTGAPALARGDLVRLRLLLDGGRPLDAIGEVRRRTGRGHHGLQLVHLRPQDRLWLERWLTIHREHATIFAPPA